MSWRHLKIPSIDTIVKDIIFSAGESTFCLNGTSYFEIIFFKNRYTQRKEKTLWNFSKFLKIYFIALIAILYDIYGKFEAVYKKVNRNQKVQEWFFGDPPLPFRHRREKGGEKGVNGLLVAKCQYHAFARITFFLFIYLFRVLSPFSPRGGISDARTTISPRTFQQRRGAAAGWLRDGMQTLG